MLCVIFTFAFTSNSVAQNKLILPKGNKNAYEKQTRQLDGNPGENYWQNTSDYFIKVSVDVKIGILKGEERIVYKNNSPDSLNKIVIRLYQDVFKAGANRMSIVNVDQKDINNGVNINSIFVDNNKLSLNPENTYIKRTGTLMYVNLDKKLSPDDNIELKIDWNFNIPKYTLIRMGTIDSTNLFIGQWYPQIAVYDDINGWDTHSYNGLAEFYNDFSNFEVEITVPENFMVWATGEPQNMIDVLQPEIYNKYKKATTSSEIINVITEDDLKKGNITSKINTWKYKANNVSDFAFGISDHYLWDVTSVEVDKTTKRKTIVGVAYNKDSKHFNKVAEIAKETVKFLSYEMPGVPYPFPYLTVYNGDFGMEYPMITNVGADNEIGTTIYANSHEITHSFFPFYVGTNETKNGWLDEGLTVFMPEKLQKELDSNTDIALYNTRVFSYYSGIEDEPAVITPTHYLDAKIYFYLNYAKTDQALRMLEMHLGEKLFKNCLLTFMERWKYKHPTPFDFFYTFNDVSKQNLNWFWQAWYFQNGGIPDLSITNVNKNENKIDITITNKGDLPLPIEISFYKNEELIKTITQPASIWQNNNSTINITFKTSETITSIKLGNELIPDSNPTDNKYLIK